MIDVNVDNYVKKAHQACQEGLQYTPSERAQWLDVIAEALQENGQRLVTVAQHETHLPEGRLNSELQRTTFQLRILGEEVRRGEFLGATVDHADAEWGVGPRPDIRKYNVPLGVVGVFGASNFPFAFAAAGGDTASALAAGCSVVHKIHDAHASLGALTTEVIVDALVQAGAPNHLFSSLNGREAGIQLVEHPLVKAVGFTGSVKGGRALFDRAAARPEPIPFYGELGSLNPVIVTEQAWSAREEQILDGFVSSFTGSLGQLCTKPGLVFVPEAVAPAARERLAEKLTDVSFSHKMLNDRIFKGFTDSLNSVASLSYADPVFEGEQSDPPSPTVFYVEGEDLESGAEVLHTEMFGPASVLISYQSTEQLINLIANLPGQLTGTVHAEQTESIGTILSALQQRCGRLVMNDWPTGLSVTYATTHGGPYPATTSASSTSVGVDAITRFVRPVTFQGFLPSELPEALKDQNALGIRRRVNGDWVL